MALRKVVITGFAAISLASLLITLSIVSLLFSSYNVVYGLNVKVLNVYKVDKTLNINISINNPTQTRLSLTYIKIVMYVDSYQFEKAETYYNNPKVLEPSSNFSLLIPLSAARGNVLNLDSTYYWFATIYMLIEDVPLIDKAYFTRRDVGTFG